MHTITQRPLAHRYSKLRTPMKTWGVLLHTTEGGSRAGLDALFIDNLRSDGVTVSVHFAVWKDGDIYCYAPWQPGKAWCCYHAGESKFGGETSVNKRFIGIEIQHKSGEAYPAAQLDALGWLLKHIQTAYKGAPEWRNVLTEHSVVAPTRKTDPTSPWYKHKAAIYAAWNAPAEVPSAQKPVLQVTWQQQWRMTPYTSGPDVAYLEWKLRKRYPDRKWGAPRGVYDGTLRDDVRTFQKDAGLPVDGVMKLTDWAVLMAPGAP